MPMPTPGGTRIENPSLESVNKHSSLVAKVVTTAFDTRDSVLF
jgi:hypothetical protein